MHTIEKAADKPQLWTKNFILISIATFLIFCSFQILMPILPKFALTLGANKTVIGLINGFFTITAVALRPITGRELDKRGRKGIYIIGLFVFLLAVCGYFWVPSLFLLLILRLVHGAGWSTASTAAVTMVADIIPPSRRGEGMGYYGLCSILAMAIAPALGLMLLDSYGFSLIFMFSLITNIGAIVAGYFIILPAYAITDNVKSKKAPLFDKRAFRVSLTLFFTTISYGGIVTFLPLYADERGISNIGLFFTIYAIALLVTRPYAGKYYDRKGPNNIILYGLLLIFVSIFILAFAKTMPVFLLSGILLGLGFGAVQPTIFAHAMVGIEPERRGIINGTVMTAFDLGMGFGSVFLGIIANMAGYANMYLITSFTVLFGLVVFFLFPGKKSNIERR